MSHGIAEELFHAQRAFCVASRFRDGFPIVREAGGEQYAPAEKEAENPLQTAHVLTLPSKNQASDQR